MKLNRTLITAAAIAASATASQSADYVKGYTKGTGSQLLVANGGAGAVTFVDQAETGGGDMSADGGNPTWGWEIGGSWVNGDKVEFTGIAMPIWANNPNTDTSQNTVNATHRIRIYTCGANNSFDGAGVAGDTLIGTVDVTFGLADAGVDEYYVNFDTPVLWASADSTSFYFYIQAISTGSGTAMRFKTGAPSATSKIKNRNDGANQTIGGATDTSLSVAGIVNDSIKTWEGDGNATADWDTTSSNWDDGVGTYTDGDVAIFNESFDTFSNTVNLTTALAPASVLVSNTSAGDVPEYVFNGTGGLTGSMSLLREGNGTLTLANTGGNDYTGATTIRTGTIKLGGDDVLSAASVLQIGGTGTSRLLVDGFDAEIGGLQSLANNTRFIENDVLGSVLTINVADTESYNFTSNITGTAGTTSIVKTGLGTQIFSRSGGYSADVLDISADAGTLIWNVKGNSGAVTVASGATLQIGNSGTSGGVGSGVTNGAGSVGDANIANDGDVSFARTDAVSYSGVINGIGDVRLNANIALTLGAAQTYSGDTFIGQGTLTATAADQLSPDSVLRIGGFSGGTSAVETNGFDQTIAGLALNGGNTRIVRNNGGSTATLTIDVETGESHNYGGNLGGSDTINFVKDGLGTQNVTRNNFTKDPGSVTANAGTLDWFVNDSYGAVAVNGSATLGLDRTGTAASFAATGTSTTNYNVAITDWDGVAGTDWPSITVTGDLSTVVGSTFTVIVTDGVTDFSEADKMFVIGTVGGTPTPLGTLNVDDSGFTAGTGTWGLAVSGSDLVLSYTAGTDPYAAWSGGVDFDVDTNGDGVANGLAFLLGAADVDANATSLLPVFTQSGGDLVMTFSMLNAAGRGSAELAIQHSSDLGITDPWSAAATVPEIGDTVGGIVFTVTPDGGINDVVATIPSSNAAAGKLFGRLTATNP